MMAGQSVAAPLGLRLLRARCKLSRNTSAHTNGAAATAEDPRRWSIRALVESNMIGCSGDAETTRKLLAADVQLRLGIQQERLSGFEKSVREYAKIASNKDVPNHLRSLMRLHDSTRQLVGQMLAMEAASAQRLASSIFDETMCRHGKSVETVADVIIQVRQMESKLPSILRRDFMNIDLLNDELMGTFLHARLMIQLLCEHYVSMSKGKNTGAVTLNADVLDVVDDALTESKHVADANLGVPIDFVIEQRGDLEAPPIIRSWLHHALVEVSKNAMMANYERWIQQPQSKHPESVPPGLHVMIDKTCADVLRIQVKDQGNGLSDEGEAFGFAKSSAQDRWSRISEQRSYAAVRQPLGSLGVGLPLSRIMMQAFGGDLTLSNHEKSASMESGCTATLEICRDDSFISQNHC
ncbi:hypothetical protein THAOC_03169 [Thalassiosira oceanica]|uniref:Protein-serine/threonine kinase n=1 Tax=Thalassiosira oceanica TaxID=159749 RepID=K0TCE8_THAOC|nr:hypothetical protein THAOC_03169 [Thalassiosira oceanica]|eukprot:EJK75120.1 hypothetical protein THAOC_03169 [Thalassiosira oceanica]